MRLLPYLFVLLLALVACSQEQSTSGAAGSTAHPALTTKMVGDSGVPGSIPVAGDSLELPPFTIDLQLSDRAARTLRAANETVLVDATFSGLPADTISRPSEGSGEVTLARRTIELSKTGPARFEKIKIDRAQFQSLADKEVLVLVNVYSGRRASADNLLDADILQDKLSVIKDHRFTLRAKLIGEN